MVSGVASQLSAGRDGTGRGAGTTEATRVPTTASVEIALITVWSSSPSFPDSHPTT
eukprot:CAMPEP_0204341276 /NCGR_PEP_ID=MMETSP0469-20131031/23223_1 /ASSEMBLY_ACC=CAM_ASM_000384 /TAXON_ID=2969 /ORGANISM="Oxyrrhis marina" /LENGTH=55 /DNA_ID=CAMNT_0051325961 /DNA_START=150 /DNA_END=314 /DNA_ORIENTATION=-